MREEGRVNQSERTDLGSVCHRSGPVCILLLHVAAWAIGGWCVTMGGEQGSKTHRAENWKTMLVWPAWRLGLCDISPHSILGRLCKGLYFRGEKAGTPGEGVLTQGHFVIHWQDKMISSSFQLWEPDGPWRFWARTALFPLPHPLQLWYLSPPHKLDTVSPPGEKGTLAGTKSIPTTPTLLGQSCYLSLECDIVPHDTKIW